MEKINENIKHIIVLIMAIVISSMISIKAATTLSSSSVYYDTSKSGGTSSNVNGAIDELYSLTTDRDKLKQDILDLTWPVGSVYISTTDSSVESVQERFGGTWVKYAEDMTLVGASSTKAVNTTGGSSSVTLSSKNIPSLSVTGTTNSTGSGYSIGYTYSTRTSTTGNTMSYRVVNAAGASYSYNHFAGWDSSNGYTAATDANYPGAYHSHNYKDYYANKITGVEAHTHAFTGNYTNNSLENVNIQNPYTAVYMYKRTA